MTLKDVNKTARPEVLLVTASNGEEFMLLIHSTKGGTVRVGIIEDNHLFKYKRIETTLNALKEMKVIK